MTGAQVVLEVLFDREDAQGVFGIRPTDMLPVRDSGSGPAPVKVGESWICVLTNCGGYYSAQPMVRRRAAPSEAKPAATGTIVEYIGNDTFYCRSFTETAYDVYASFDGSVFEFVPNPEGTIRCRGSKLVISGLGDIIKPFDVREFACKVEDKVITGSPKDKKR